MLVHHRLPGFTHSAQLEGPGRPLRTVIGDVVKRFLRATKPPARVGAGAGAIVLTRLVRAVLWFNLYLAGGAALAVLWTLSQARTIIPTAILTILILVARAAWNLVLLPFHHVSLAIVGVAAAIEGLLAGRVFVQLAYEPTVNGIAGTVLELTDPIVAPFQDLEGTPLLHDTGVVEFATLTAMEAVLVATIAAVVLLMFWSEFLHMYRRVAMFFIERAERRQQRYAEEDAEPEAAAPAPVQKIESQSAATADLSAAS